MKKSTERKIIKIIGYVLAALFLAAGAYLMLNIIKLNMFPTSYMVILGFVLAIVFILLLIMHEKKVTSIIAIFLSFILAAGCMIGADYVQQTNKTLTEIATVDVETSLVSVYVLDEDKAEHIEDIKDYTIGIVTEQEREKVDSTIGKIEDDLGGTLSISEAKNMFVLLDELKEQKTQAIIINEAYIGIMEEVEEYQWVSDGIRKITEYAHVTESGDEMETPVEVPETFVMYLSGIDTYGGVSARSRSDVNILAVVNTKTKNILLLSTPRDSYVSYSVTGSAKDKLTHAGIYGVEASIDALEQLYGINVDYYLRINFSGFIDVIDALGGIDVYSEYEFTVEPVKTYQVGYNHLSGIEALAFARERYSFSEGDYQRAKNQMEVIRALIDKAVSSSMLANYKSVMDAVSGSFETSMPDEQIAALVKMQLSDMSGWDIVSYTTSGPSSYEHTFSMPGRSLYVVNLDQASIDEAKRLIQEVQGVEQNNENEVTSE